MHKMTAGDPDENSRWFDPSWYIFQNLNYFSFLDLDANRFPINTQNSGFSLEIEKTLIHISYINTYQGMKRSCHLSTGHLISSLDSSLLSSTLTISLTFSAWLAPIAIQTCNLG